MSDTRKPPYRADHVGSLLRPQSVKDARKSFFEDRSIDRDELREVEDAAVRDEVKLQQDLGLLAVTDGEMRRSWWHYDFMELLTGMELEERDEGIAFAGAQLRPLYPCIKGLLDFPADHPHLEHFRFLASVADVTPKISIPGPSCCHYRGGAGRHRTT